MSDQKQDKANESKPSKEAEPKPQKVKEGDKLWFVLADGSSVPAKATKVRSDQLVDLVAEYQGELVVTRSPRDDTGKKHDSWRPYTDPFKKAD